MTPKWQKLASLAQEMCTLWFQFSCAVFASKCYPFKNILNQFHSANLALNSDVDQDTLGKVTLHNKHDSQEVSPFPAGDHKATRSRHDSTTYQHEALLITTIHKRSTAWERSVKKVRKRAKIRNRYNQAPHLTKDTNGKVTTSQLDITNESQEVSPFSAGDHKASTNRRA